MTQPTNTDVADVPVEVKREVVAARQPDSDSGSHFHRVFQLPAGAVPQDDAAHEAHRWNKVETVRDAVRRGLHPTSDEVSVDAVETQPDGTQRVTYSVPVEPTGSAVAVTVAKPSAAPKSEQESTSPETPAKASKSKS